MTDEELLATVKARADRTAQELGAGFFIMVHAPDLGIAYHFSTDGAGSVDLQISRRGREAFERIVRDALDQSPEAHEHCLAMKIPGEASTQ